jgi:hypothetical protein
MELEPHKKGCASATLVQSTYGSIDHGWQPFHLCVYCVLPWKFVAPPFHYVEKGDENDAAISWSVSATLFFRFVKQKTKFCGKNFTKFHLFRKKKFCEINIKNFVKYEGNYLAKFCKILLCEISSTTLQWRLYIVQCALCSILNAYLSSVVSP